MASERRQNFYIFAEGGGEGSQIIESIDITEKN